MSETITLARQMRMLLEHKCDPNGRSMSVADLTREIDLTQQTLQNILHQRIDNPRLNTLRVLCVFYGISLDYFDLPTEEMCYHYLAAQQLKLAPSIIHQIDHETRCLTAKGQRNILAVLEWMNVASSKKS
jgi:hypothetical protein